MKYIEATSNQFDKAISLIPGSMQEGFSTFVKNKNESIHIIPLSFSVSSHKTSNLLSYMVSMLNMDGFIIPLDYSFMYFDNLIPIIVVEKTDSTGTIDEIWNTKIINHSIPIYNIVPCFAIVFDGNMLFIEDEETNYLYFIYNSTYINTNLLKNIISAIPLMRKADYQFNKNSLPLLDKFLFSDV